MANTPTVYVICDQNCKFEGMTKEQILTAIAQAVSSGEITDVDAGFITTIKTLNNVALKFFYGTQAAYDALTAAEKENLFAIITNDTFKTDINAAIEQLNTDLEELQEKLESGDIVVGKAAEAESAAEADKLKAEFFRYGTTTTNYMSITLENKKAYLVNMYISYEYHTVVLLAMGYGNTVRSTSSGYSGYYCKYFGTDNTLKFYNGSGEQCNVERVYIREI